MASISEQLVANLSWNAWAKAKDLHKRIFFTLGIFIIYRLGTYIPLPGINPVVMKSLVTQYNKGFLGMFNVVSGGALERMSVFALNLMPYISSSIIVQLMSAVVPSFMALKKEGDAGKRKLSQYTRYGTVGLAIFQSLSIASLLSLQPGLVFEPGVFFHITTLITIVGATLFLMWLGEQVTTRGLGNGSSMIIYAGIMANIPGSLLRLLESSRMGAISSGAMLIGCIGVVAIIAFIVFMERSYRKVIVQYPKIQTGRQVYEKNYMPLKLNTTGVLPIIFTTALLGFFKTIASWSLVQKIPYVNVVINYIFADSGPIALLVQVAFIVFFSFFYTTVVFNPEETAENLRKSGAFIPGNRPGAMTADYFKYLLNRLTVLGASYIAFIMVLPNLVEAIFNMKFMFQGSSFLIAVSVSLEIISQVHSFIISHQYEPLFRRKKP